MARARESKTRAAPRKFHRAPSTGALVWEVVSRALIAACSLLLACSSSSETGKDSGAAGAGSDTCPDVSGTWKVSEHCESSLVGASLMVTQRECALSFAPPFDQFTGSVSVDDRITLTGPQNCTGSASASAVSMVCTPGTCQVSLSR